MKSHGNVIVNCQSATIGALSFAPTARLLYYFTSTIARSLDGGRRRRLVNCATIELPVAICLSGARLWRHLEVIGEPPTERVTSQVSPRQNKPSHQLILMDVVGELQLEISLKSTVIECQY